MFSLGEKVDTIDSLGQWYNAKVEAVRNEEFLVSFTNWGEEWNRNVCSNEITFGALHFTTWGW